jgi:hypothetical protein
MSELKTICDLLEEDWCGGAATIEHASGLNRIYIKDNGALHIPEPGMTIRYAVRGWLEIKIP